MSPSIKRAIRGKHNYSSYLVVYFGPKRFLLIALFISFGCENVKEYLSRSSTGPSSTPVRRRGFFSESLVSLTDVTSSSLSYNQFRGLFSSSKTPQFQNEAKCTTFDVKMSFICMRMKNYFHTKGWALNLDTEGRGNSEMDTITVFIRISAQPRISAHSQGQKI